MAALAKYVALYREEAQKQGYTASPMQFGWSVPTYVAETDEQAYREAKPHIENMVNKFPAGCHRRCCCRLAISRCNP